MTVLTGPCTLTIPTAPANPTEPAATAEARAQLRTVGASECGPLVVDGGPDRAEDGHEAEGCRPSPDDRELPAWAASTGLHTLAAPGIACTAPRVPATGARR
jgi:hypothetical protein